VRKLIVFVVVIAIVGGGLLFLAAGRMPGPAIEIARPEKFVGASTPVDVLIDAPGRQVSSIAIEFEQEGTRTPLFSYDADAAGSTSAAVNELVPVEDAPDRLRITREVGRASVPAIKSGAARIVVRAARPVLYGFRTVESEAVRDVQVRLERPRVSVVSTHHYINHGGSELVVYRVTPDDVDSGVRVGDLEYPGFKAPGVRFEGGNFGDPSLRLAFFALRYDQPLDAPMHVFARDEAGNTARANFDFRVFPKPFRKSRIELNDAFLARVVPAILEGTTDIAPTGTPIEQFVAINSELRRKNAEKIASFAGGTAPDLLWAGMVFHPFTNSSAESAFADHRTYIYQGREVDRQVHLGFDLASFAGTPILAANRGRVLFADELGIYGNCVIIDHGLGVQSLYAHLSSIDARVGDMVDKEQPIGRSGMTGLAGGDHLHFTMLVNGQMVNPIEWWDAHWIEDRILRKLRAAK
jgi:murein DD-endopeptidase MepM/ murein hydrolase activator NlpD